MSIAGKAGQTIQQIEKDSGAKIKVLFNVCVSMCLPLGMSTIVICFIYVQDYFDNSL